MLLLLLSNAIELTWVNCSYLYHQGQWQCGLCHYHHRLANQSGGRVGPTTVVVIAVPCATAPTSQLSPLCVYYLCLVLSFFLNFSLCLCLSCLGCLAWSVRIQSVFLFLLSLPNCMAV